MSFNKIDAIAIVFVSLICIMCIIFTSWFIYDKCIKNTSDESSENDSPENVSLV